MWVALEALAGYASRGAATSMKWQARRQTNRSCPLAACSAAPVAIQASTSASRVSVSLLRCSIPRSSGFRAWRWLGAGGGAGADDAVDE